MIAPLAACHLLTLCLTSHPQSAPAPQRLDVRLPDSRLLDNGALEQRMNALAAAHPKLAQSIAVGTSRGGARIGALRLSDGEPPAGRPAILVVANIDGPQTFGSALALAHAEAIAAGAASDEKVRAFLARTTLYIVPRANPDAAAARFAKPLLELEATGSGIDDDRDRRVGEDPPADVDGDGVIAWMRWKDPEGEWILDPLDARALVKADAKKGQRGEYKLAIEGRDLDRDETPSEDAPRDAIVNQNFAHDWQEHGAHAGRFPMDEPEARALAEFVLQHKDIALVLTYGALDTLVEKPKSVADNAPPQKRIPQPGWLESDAGLLAELGKRYGELTSNKTKGRGSDAGSFQAWAYQHRGLWSLAIAPWDIPLDGDAKKDEAKAEGAASEPSATQPAESKPAESKPSERGKKDKEKDEPKPSDDVKRLKWIDANGEGARFVPWKAFQHPELGAVEIGGFAPFARSEPPTAAWSAIAAKELEFLLSLGADLPRIAIEKFEARAQGAGLLEIEAVVVNEALLPAANRAARRAEVSRPLKALLVLPAGAKLVGGQPQTLIRDLDGLGRRELRWLVVCDRPGRIELRVDSDNAGAATASVEVKP
ncbi:MAG: hypothetical protein EPO68_10440 [Planctomycetota bacterium]|nr:MAG: hypothetical protein EPO68_10440 [Planctomycetota bacterium]